MCSCLSSVCRLYIFACWKLGHIPLQIKIYNHSCNQRITTWSHITTSMRIWDRDRSEGPKTQVVLWFFDVDPRYISYICHLNAYKIINEAGLSISLFLYMDDNIVLLFSWKKKYIVISTILYLLDFHVLEKSDRSY